MKTTYVYTFTWPFAGWFAYEIGEWFFRGGDWGRWIPGLLVMFVVGFGTVIWPITMAVAKDWFERTVLGIEPGDSGEWQTEAADGEGTVWSGLMAVVHVVVVFAFTLWSVFSYLINQLNLAA